MKQAIIFGAAGQDGFFLTEHLQKLDYNVFTVFRPKGDDYSTDIKDFTSIQSFIKDIQPDYIFHFAANSTTKHEALFENNASIGTGTLNILESARLYSPSTKIFISGSAVQFINTGTPINENTPFDAKSAYAASRIYATYMSRYFRKTFNMPIYIGYFFNHDSPLRTEQHVNKKITSAVNRISLGSKEKLTLGAMDVEKEFNFAGDIIKAVWTLVNQEDVFEAVLGCGETHTIAKWVEYCFSAKNLDWQDHVEIKPGYTPEYTRLVSDPSLIFSLGWRPKTSFTELADMMLEKP